MGKQMKITTHALPKERGYLQEDKGVIEDNSIKSEVGLAIL